MEARIDDFAGHVLRVETLPAGKELTIREPEALRKIAENVSD